MKTLGNLTDRQEILSRIALLSREDRRKWGRMSVGQAVCHLTDSYRLALGEKAANSATGFLQQTLMKWTALRSPLPWMKGFPTRPEVEQGKGGTTPGEFEADKNALLAIVGRFCEALAEISAPHPVFGPMSAEEWERWGYLHADHHLRQFGR